MPIIRTNFTATNHIPGETVIRHLAGSTVMPDVTGNTCDPVAEGYSGVWYRSVVTIKDVFGRARSKASDAIWIPPRDVPAPPDAPVSISVTPLSSSEVRVQWSAASSGEIAAGFNVTWTQGATQQFLPGATSPLLITGLAADTDISVVVSAYNDAGETEAAAVVGRTDVTPVVAQPPGILPADQWSVVDLTTGGDASVTVRADPDNGGATITARYYRIGLSGTPTSTGLTGPGSFAIANGFTDGVATDLFLGFENSAGVTWTAAQSITTTTYSAPSASSTTAEFGEFTLADAGGYRPLDSSGNGIVLQVGTTPTRVSGTGTGAKITGDGRLAFSATGQAVNGDVWRVTRQGGGTVDVTISVIANAYHVATYSQAYAASMAVPGAGGRRVIFRRTGSFAIGDALSSERILAKGKVFTSTVTFEGEGVWDQLNYQTDNPKTKINNGIKFQCDNFTMKNLWVECLWTTQQTLVEVYEPTTNYGVVFTLEDCKISGLQRDTDLVWEASEFGPGTTKYTVGLTADKRASPTIRRCYFDNVTRGININVGARGVPVVIEYNLMEGMAEDFIKLNSSNTVGLVAGVLVRRNVFQRHIRTKHSWIDLNGDGVRNKGDYDGVGAGETIAEGIHGDTMQFGGNQGRVWENVVIYQNASCYKYDPQGWVAWNDGYSDGKDSALHKDLIFVGNFMSTASNHCFVLNTSGGVIRNNTFVTPSRNSGADKSGDKKNIWPGFKFTAPDSVLNTAPWDTSRPVYADNNITEGYGLGPSWIIKSNNLEIGWRGQTVAYQDVFDDTEASFDAPVDDYAAARTHWASLDPTRGAFGATGLTWGEPMVEAGWYIDPDLLVNAPL